MNQSTEQRVAAARARMAELKDKFIERSHDDLQTLRNGFSGLRGGDVATLRVIVQLAHRMSGTGATLGLGTLSERAQRIEKLAEAQAPGTLPDAEGLDRLGAAIEALAAELVGTPRA